MVEVSKNAGVGSEIRSLPAPAHEWEPELACR